MYHHVYIVTLSDRKRRLPSARAIWMPPGCGEEASVGSQLPLYGLGMTWNLEAGPKL